MKSSPQSMTGFGQSSITIQKQPIRFEIKGLNHRYLEPKFRMPSSFQFLEPQFRGILQKHLKRGRVEVSIIVEQSSKSGTNIRLNQELAKGLKELYQDFCQALGEQETKMSLWELFQFQGVLTEGLAYNDILEHTEDILEGFKQATQAFFESRKQEGENLAVVLNEYIQELNSFVSEIEALVAKEPARLSERLKERYQDLAKELSLSEIDPARFHQEVAILVDKADVNEEIVRLKSHLSQFAKMLQKSSDIGRKLDFLCQEFLREFNTIGSKSQLVDITQLVISGKATIAKIREQVQNIE